MAEIIFKDSPYRFTDPIRYFKANDPYYWEVENIPIKQLEENIKWVKDQISETAISDVQRSDIAELKPYVTGQDNVVRVKTGRFTARVNDVYGIEPLQLMTQVLGTELEDTDAWRVLTSNNASITDIIDRLKTRVEANFLGLNGLIERAFTYPVQNEELGLIDNVDAEGGPTIKDVAGIKKSPFPLSEVLLWAAGKEESSFIVRAFASDNFPKGFMPLAMAESHAIKRWRGTARTAIVDVPEELEIEIPPFNEAAYFYTEDGQKNLISGVTNRIDLVFIYSKPIDTSSITVGKWVDGSPTQLTAPQLGVVYGAGVGVDFTELNSVTRDFQASALGQDADGNSQILPNASDQLMTDGGFKGLGVYGSFPAPDDLLNIAPVLSESLESDSPLLVGQSILPVAYVVTTSTDSLNASGTNILTDSSIIDIRPLFRTAELTYNERAGIAGAIPALSLANPAVGKAQLDLEKYRITLDYNSKINALKKETNDVPRVVATGYVLGGTNFGVEGALIDYLSTKNNGGSLNQLLQELRKSFSTTEIDIPDYPQWDLSRWVVEGNYSSKGAFPNDYINTHVQRNTLNPADFGCYVNQSLDLRATEFGTDNIVGKKGTVCIHFVSKTIPIDRTKVTWMGDYNVDVQLWNCVPLSNRAHPFQSDGAAGAAHVWVDKKQNSFTIYVAWVANDFIQAGNEAGSLVGDTTTHAGANFKTPHNNRLGSLFAGFAVINEDIIRYPSSTEAFTGEAQAGVAIYPSIQFSITGIPKVYGGQYGGVGRNQTIILR